MCAGPQRRRRWRCAALDVQRSSRANCPNTSIPPAPWPPMDSLLQDLRFALRTLLRRRTFSMVAIMTIALGIGALTSIYSVVDGVLLRPLPFPEAGRLVAVWQTFPPWLKVAELARIWDLVPLSLPDFRDWQAAQTSFD